MIDDRDILVRALRVVFAASEEIVVIGGSAHQLHAEHELALASDREILRTRDIDLVPPASLGATRLDLQLAAGGFESRPSGESRPPMTRYVFAEDTNSYVEFVTQRRGSGTRRDGSRGETEVIGGIVATKLADIDVLAAHPWTMKLESISGFEIVGGALSVRLCNPACFIAQKLLIRTKRERYKRAKDVAYIYDTLQMFGRSLPLLAEDWSRACEVLGPTTRVRVAREATTFLRGDELIRDATALLRDLGRDPAPTVDEMKRTLEMGLRPMFGAKS